MRLALTELRRRPGRFVAAVVILGALAVLLMFLGGLLDGLLASSTGAYRVQQADVVVYSADARDSLPRSRIDPSLREEVATAAGAGETGGLGSVQLGARPEAEPDSRDLISAAVIGYELAPAGLPAEPPDDGEVIADESIRADDVELGDVLLLGPARSPVEVVGFVTDTQYSGQATLWASLDTWRSVTAENRPDLAFGDGSVQALVVRAESGSPAELATAIDEATGGATATRSLGAAIDALPGVDEQRSTFNQIIGVTAAVAAVVIALFFALITVERSGLYGVLKAVGASSATLFAGVAAQAVILAIVASAIGTGAAVLLDAVIPPGALPFEVTWSRLLTSAALMIAAAVIGSAFSLRRVVRIDPATAIGASS
jgi:putative ABC transport system permease protein